MGLWNHRKHNVVPGKAVGIEADTLQAGPGLIEMKRVECWIKSGGESEANGDEGSVRFVAAKGDLVGDDEFRVMREVELVDGEKCAVWPVEQRVGVVGGPKVHRPIVWKKGDSAGIETDDATKVCPDV